jgi:hypothetical protein
MRQISIPFSPELFVAPVVACAGRVAIIASKQTIRVDSADENLTIIIFPVMNNFIDEFSAGRKLQSILYTAA